MPVPPRRTRATGREGLGFSARRAPLQPPENNKLAQHGGHHRCYRRAASWDGGGPRSLLREGGGRAARAAGWPRRRPPRVRGAGGRRACAVAGWAGRVRGGAVRAEWRPGRGRGGVRRPGCERGGRAGVGGSAAAGFPGLDKQQELEGVTP